MIIDKENKINVITLADNSEYVIRHDGMYAKGPKLAYKECDFVSIQRSKEQEQQASEGQKPATWGEYGKFRNVLKEFAAIDDKIQSEIKSSGITKIHDGEYEHNSKDPYLKISTWPYDFTVNTGNIVGTIFHKQEKSRYKLTIGSRFGDNFLKYIIDDANGFLELQDQGSVHTSNDYGWLLYYLWITQLKKAYRIGMPKQYISNRDRLTKVRGNVDVVDYFINNKTGKYLCDYREHSYDNPAASLIVKAFQIVNAKHKEFCASARSIYTSFLTATGGRKRTIKDLLQTPHFTNPFYSEYNQVIDYAKKILNSEGMSFDQENDFSAFVFDVSMLFEYFIRNLIKRQESAWSITLEEKNEANALTIPSGGTYNKGTRRLYPDLAFTRVNPDTGSKEYFIFDVKYKNYDEYYGIDRNDLFQLHTYIARFGNQYPVKACGLIYPSKSKESAVRSEDDIKIISEKITQHRLQMDFCAIFLPIPEDSGEFKVNMKGNCDKFLQKLSDFCFKNPNTAQ